MTTKTITLALEGEVPMGAFADAFAGLRTLVEALSQEVGGGAPIRWLIDQLESGSALATVRGESESEDAIRRVADAYLEVGQAQGRGLLIPYSPKVSKAAASIAAVLNGATQSVRFETEEGEATIYSHAPATPPQKPIVRFGAVTGRIQTLSSRGGLRFTLYDTLYDKAVSCYLEPDSEEIMRGVWGKMATAEGVVTRDATSGRPLSVRHVRRVTPRLEVAAGSFRAARGLLSFAANSPSAEDIIRRERDTGWSAYG